MGSLITWISSFATYVAVISQTHLDRVIDMLAYMRLIIREASKHGGQDWLTYDTIFRRNHQGASERWNILDSSLHTAYIAGQSLPPRVPCKHCNETDHFPEDCALAPLIPSVRPSQRERQPPFARPPKCPASAGTAQGVQKRLCISWNRGQCAFPGACSYKHCCTLCDSSEHRAKDCPRAPPDSAYRIPPRRPNPPSDPSPSGPTYPR